MDGMSKMKGLINQICNAKPYMESKSLNDVRDTFRLRTKMIDGIRGNFRNMYPGNKGNCEGCGKVLETQAHVVDCAEFSDIREGLDMSKDRNMVKFKRIKEKESWKDKGPVWHQAKQTSSKFTFCQLLQLELWKKI